MTDGSLTFDTKIDSGTFNKGMDDLNKSAKTGFEKMASTVSDKIGITDIALGNMLGNLAGNLIGGVINNAGKFVSDSIEIASNLAEVQNVVDTTFEGGASEINKWAKAAKEAYGMSELKAKKYTSTIGSMFKSMGLADDQVLSMSEGITGLAGDMASFYNLDHDTAFEKLRAGISGETEPLKQLGINMSVANLEAFALSEGITKSYDSMSQAEQTQLRYNYLMKATADAQGDFAKTSDGYANQQRILATTMEELSATVGSIFLPAVTAGVNGLNVLATGAKDVVSAIANIFNPPKKDELSVAVNNAITTLGGIRSEIDNIKNNYAKTTVEIELKYKKSEALVADLQALQNENTLTANQVSKLQETSQSLVDLYPGLAQYVGADGIIHKEAGEVSALIKQYANLDRELAYFTMVSSLETQKAQADIQLEILQQLYDTAKEKAGELATSASSIETTVANLWSALSGGPVDTSVPAYLKAAQGYLDTFKTLEGIDTSKITGFSELFTDMGQLKSAEEISASSTAIQALYKLVLAMSDTSLTQSDALNASLTTANENAATAKKAWDDYSVTVTQTGAELEAASKVFEKKWGMTPDEYRAQQQGLTNTGDAAEKAAAKVAKYLTSTGEDLRSAGEKAADALDNIQSAGGTLEEANARIKTAHEKATAAQTEQQKAIDKDQELAELTTTIANNIDAAAAKGQTAVIALQNQHTFITNEAAGIVTEIENLATDLGLYVQAMKDAMIDIIAKSETDAASAGEKVAKGTSDGYKKTPYLRTAVQSSVVQSVAVIQAYFNAFENAGYSIASNMASGVRSGSSELSGAVSAIVKSALSAARTAAGATSGTSSASGRYATGLYSVPYNGFVLEAHKEERLLTAQEAKYVPRDVTSIGQATPVIDIEALAAALKTGNDGGVSITVVLDGETVADVMEPKISALQGKRLRLKG